MLNERKLVKIARIPSNTKPLPRERIALLNFLTKITNYNEHNYCSRDNCFLIRLSLPKSNLFVADIAKKERYQSEKNFSFWPN